MKQNSLENKDAGLDAELKVEKERLGENAEEVLGLLSEKDPNTFTEKAKFILSQVGLGATSLIAFAGMMGIVGGGAVAWAKTVDGAPFTPEQKELAKSIFVIGLLATTLGTYAASKFEDLSSRFAERMSKQQN